MNKPFIHKNLFTVITILIVSLLLGGCVEKKSNVNVDELLPQSIETMKNLNSYKSTVQIEFSSKGEKVNMNAIITMHKEPFAYSNIQEITSIGKSKENTLDKIVLSLFVKDGVVYTNNSIVGFWMDEEDPELLKQVEENSDMLHSFSPDQFGDLTVVSTDKGKIKLKGETKNSGFLKQLMDSFDAKITGEVEMIIDNETKYLESFIYYPTIDGKTGKENKITLTFRDFNTATNVEIPKEALSN